MNVDPALFHAMALKSGIRLYAKTGMKPARDWTPTNMLRTAEQITGLKFKRGEFEKAAQALQCFCDHYVAEAAKRGVALVEN